MIVAQHFLLSAKARTLSLKAVGRMSDEEAHDAFQQIRWSDNNGEPYCPKCGCVAVYKYETRKLWKCKGCNHQFSVTSGTIFANRKMPIRDILLAIAVFVNGAKGISALQLGRDLDCQYKTAFVLAHKLREAINGGDKGKVSGNVEIDGCYVGGYVKPANWKENRRDRRLACNQNGKRRVVVILRERGGKTLPFVFRSEDAAVPTIESHVAPGSTIFADEASSWDTLHDRYLTKRINHGEAYSTAEACTNQAESFFSRLRRAEIGQHHHISGPYLGGYASEMSWREDNRRLSSGELYLIATNAALKAPVSRTWKGYWQRTVS
jgi:transposase-like protein